MYLTRVKSCIFSSHTPNITTCGTKLEGKVMFLLDIHALSWSHKLRALGHITNKCMTDSFSCLQSEH